MVGKLPAQLLDALQVGLADDEHPVARRFRDIAWRQLGTSGSGNHFVEFGALTVHAAIDSVLGRIPPGTYLALLVIFLVARCRGLALRRTVFWLVLVMALLAAASQFGIQPLLAQLKADALPRGVMESVLRDRFAAWHGISSIVYLVQSLLGLWLAAWAGRGLK